MNIELSKTQIGILEALCDQWFKYLSPSEIAEITELSISSIYESVKELIEKNIILEFNGRFKINFSNELAWGFKRLNDSSKLLKLPKDIQNKIFEIREKARLFYLSDLIAFLVFGSAASLDITKQSDVDFLLILKERPKEANFLNFLTSEDKNFHLIENDAGEFNNNYAEGDDFILSILKNHILLQGDDYIRYFLEKDLPIVSKKIIHDREVKLKKLKDKIDALLFSEQPILFEKVKEFIKLQCRVFLMKSNITPQSNKELLEYMKEKYPAYYKAYKSLKRNNFKNIYIKLARD